MTKTLKLPLVFIALACSLPLAAPAFAQDDVLIVSQSALQQWQEEQTRELDRLLGIERRSFGEPEAGIVQVSFTLDAKGRPTGFETLHNSAGDASLRMARWAVSRMRNLGDVPVESTAGLRFQANVIFADTASQKDELASKLAAMEAVRLASARTGSAVVAIG